MSKEIDRLDRKILRALQADGRTLGRNFNYRKLEWSDRDVQLNLIGHFDTAGFAHTLLTGVEYEDYDVDAEGLPCDREDYEFSVGILSNRGTEVEFRVDVNKTTGQYSVSVNELLEIKTRAAALFAAGPN